MRLGRSVAVWRRADFVVHDYRPAICEGVSFTLGSTRDIGTLPE